MSSQCRAMRSMSITPRAALSSGPYGICQVK
jgi:hypothetical protein